MIWLFWQAILPFAAGYCLRDILETDLGCGKEDSTVMAGLALLFGVNTTGDSIRWIYGDKGHSAVTPADVADAIDHYLLTGAL